MKTYSLGEVLRLRNLPLIYYRTKRASDKYGFSENEVFDRYTFNVNSDLVLLCHRSPNIVIPKSMITKYGDFISD